MKSEESNRELAKTISDLKDENVRLKEELEVRQLQLDEARSAKSVDDSSLEVKVWKENCKEEYF